MRSMRRQRYDHRIRDAVVDSGDITLFPELGIPDSILRSWLRRGPRQVLTALDSVDDVKALRIHVAKLERQVGILRAVLRLLMTLVRATGINLTNLRIPSASDKSRLIRGVERAAPIIGRQAALRVLGLRQARLREWMAAARDCRLDDAPPCPRSVPTRLTAKERQSIRDMVEADEYKHLSLRSLAILAQRMGRVFAAYGTWCRRTRTWG